jgi:hypothetical protein
MQHDRQLRDSISIFIRRDEVAWHQVSAEGQPVHRQATEVLGSTRKPKCMKKMHILAMSNFNH